MAMETISITHGLQSYMVPLIIYMETMAHEDITISYGHMAHEEGISNVFFSGLHQFDLVVYVV